MPQYQSWDSVKGGSNSAEKLERLRLPLLGSLKGKSVLDLGCNEGFFCHALLKMGAKRVLGIDKSPPLIRKARERVPRAEFQAGSFWSVAEEQFDIILFLSAVHYEYNQRALFDKLLSHLKPDGTLILECGLASNKLGLDAWMQIYRGTDPEPKRYPTLNYLVNYLMPRYIVTGVGESVQQKGDPVQRWVMHCRHRKPVVVIVTGDSGSGKTVVGDSLASKAIPVYRTDALFRRLINSPLYQRTPLAKKLREQEGKGLVLRAARIIEDNPDLIAELVKIIRDETPLEAEISCIEGEIFRRQNVAAAMVAALKERGAIVWTTHRD